MGGSGRKTRRRRGEVGWGEGRGERGEERREGGGVGGERMIRAYTVEVQTASVFCSRRVLSYIS